MSPDVLEMSDRVAHRGGMQNHRQSARAGGDPSDHVHRSPTRLLTTDEVATALGVQRLLCVRHARVELPVRIAESYVGFRTDALEAPIDAQEPCRPTGGQWQGSGRADSRPPRTTSDNSGQAPRCVQCVPVVARGKRHSMGASCAVEAMPLFRSSPGPQRVFASDGAAVTEPRSGEGKGVERP